MLVPELGSTVLAPRNRRLALEPGNRKRARPVHSTGTSKGDHGFSATNRRNALVCSKAMEHRNMPIRHHNIRQQMRYLRLH